MRRSLHNWSDQFFRHSEPATFESKMIPPLSRETARRVKDARADLVLSNTIDQ
jgi:hypothetical protein